MRKVLMAVAAISLLVGLHVQPADAHYLEPGQYSVDSAYNCSVVTTYFDYGSNGIAQLQIYAPNPDCSISTGVAVVTAHGDHTHEQWCFADQAIYAPTSNCYMVQGVSPFMMRAVVVGDSFTVKSYPCWIDNCYLRTHGYFG